MSETSGARVLRTMEPPVEPKKAYPDLQLASDEQLSLIRGSTFLTATRSGDLMPPGAPNIGLFYDDTRFLSQLELRVNRQQPVILSSNTADADMASVELTVRGSAVPGDNLDLPLNTVYVHRQQLLGGDRLYDTIDLHSFHDQEVNLVVDISFAADFMDIFQVRGLLRGKSGSYFEPEVTASTVRLLYKGLDDRSRETEVCFMPQPQALDGRCARWELRLPPHGKYRIATTVCMKVDLAEKTAESFTCAAETIEHERPAAIARHDQWRANCTRFRSDNEIFDVMLDTSTEDFYALRMPESCGTAVAAGVPWFAALFGRDSLLSSYETLLLDPELARGTLCVLAGYQGTTSNDERDEDPGKILHERRSGEMTATGEVAFGRSYGSVDATPLFLILAQEYFSWTADRALLEQLKEPLKAATNWILRYGDLDGDGLVEYCRRNPKGLFNQGWKDSGDANRHSDGAIAQPPIALIEVQGYAVRALAAASALLGLLGEHALVAEAQGRSDQLRELIEKRFWLDERANYAMALDRDKSPLRVDASNPGHLLFAGAIPPGRARQVADRLLSADLFCGWGIRTLSHAEQFYNPMSYHCGSVWPHDNAIIGYGMARYGMHKEAAAIFQALYDAALHFREYRLPELFCGIKRQSKGEPVKYPVSCSPQAWAAGSPLLLLTGLLGLRPNAAAGELVIVDPHLPPFLNTFRIENLRIGASRITLDFQRQGERTHCNVGSVEGNELKISVVFRSTTAPREYTP